MIDKQEQEFLEHTEFDETIFNIFLLFILYFFRLTKNFIFEYGIIHQ